ncbi:MAG: hypothetical protein D3904_09070 [Candidatus Electrothrix sp. EH2]|nr:hypothetical protein [Candidatus Electrothrix sp. EH2]
MRTFFLFGLTGKKTTQSPAVLLSAAKRAERPIWSKSKRLHRSGLKANGATDPANRKRGDDFRAVEFLQVKDSEIQKNEPLELIEKLKKTL